MKKFTLLAIASLAFGTAFADFESKTVYDLETSDPSDGAEATRSYYKVKNMRAMRLDYTNKKVVDQNGDSIGYDGAVYTIDSLLYWFEGMDGWSEDLDGTPIYDASGKQEEITRTSGPNGNAYMGLSALGGNWWLSFSGQSEIKSPYTEYWWFEDGGVENTLYIHNAVVSGIVSGSSGSVSDMAGWTRSNMDFKDKDLRANQKVTHRYYVLPVKPAFEEISTDDVNWVDSVALTAEELNQAYALCKNPTITQKGATLSDGNTNDGDCLDMNNYMNYKYRGHIVDPETYEVSETYYNYGFAGVDRTWTPTTDNGSNRNHWVNNGTIFLFEKADAADAVKAIDAYQDQITAELMRGVIETAKGKAMTAVNTLNGWANVPNIFGTSNASTLNAIAAEIGAWNGQDGINVEITGPADIETYSEAVDNYLDAKLAQGAAVVGTGCKVRFRNILSFQDHTDFLEGTIDDSYKPGHAYIAAGGDVTFRDNGAQWIVEEDNCMDHGIVPELDGENDPYCVWELIPVSGTPRFMLYNEATGEYIREYSDMYDFVSGDDNFSATSDVNSITWATTEYVAKAAQFNIIGCPYDEDTYTMSQDEEDLYWNVVTDELSDDGVLNNVRLQGQWEVETVNSLTGQTSSETEYGYIARASITDFYSFVKANPTYYSFLADNTLFKVYSVEQGAISDVVAAEKLQNSGIYDLQGRKVTNAAKGGLYIINGVKTLVK